MRCSACLTSTWPTGRWPNPEEGLLDMATTITPEELFFGAPASLTVGGVETGATVDAPKVSIEITEYTPDFQGARGPVKGTKFITKVLLKVALRINEFSATKLGWALPGSVAASGAGTVTTAGH